MYLKNKSNFYKQNRIMQSVQYVQYSAKSGFKSIGQMFSTNKPMEKDSHNKHTRFVNNSF